MTLLPPNDIPVVYADDTDPSWTFEVKDPNGQDLDIAAPKAAVGGGSYDIDATWLDATPAPTRRLRVPLTGIPGGGHRYVYLHVPGGNDVLLGVVDVRTRS